jgi:hypothetical protein
MALVNVVQRILKCNCIVTLVVKLDMHHLKKGHTLYNSGWFGTAAGVH